MKIMILASCLNLVSFDLFNSGEPAPKPLFSERTIFEIPREIAFLVDPTPPCEELIALGEDFDLEDLETESQTTGDEKNDATQGEEDIEFISPRGVKTTSDIAYNYLGDVAACTETSLSTVVSVASSNQGILAGMVHVASASHQKKGFFIKPYKVTNREYLTFVNALNYSLPSHWVEGNIPPGLEDLPVVNVSYKDAFLYAVWAGKRLPNTEELEVASRDLEDLADFGDASFEWTATPSPGKAVSKTDVPGAVSLGGASMAAHFVMSFDKKTSMHNDTSNNNTGFRIAADAY